MVNNSFYYGVHTPSGFYSLTGKPQFTDNFGYIIKGHSPSVKQQLFDRIFHELECRGFDSIDFRTADSCVGIYSQDAGFHIIDGTYPEQHEPITYGASDKIISLSDFQDCGWLEKHSEEIQHCLDEKFANLARSQRFLFAAQSIEDDMIRIESECIDTAKITRYTSKLWQRYGGTLSGKIGIESKRFVSCIAADGIELDTLAFETMCDKMIVLVDKTGACSRIITDRLRRYALSSGYDVISCLCPMNIAAGPEHIIVPQLRFGVFVSKYYHRADFGNSKRVFVKRFILPELENSKNRLDFSMKAYHRLMDEVFISLAKVRECDCTINCLYHCATDIEKLNESVIKMLFE